MKLDNNDAPNWFTAGDLYRSVCKALPPEEVERPDLWMRFATTLANETAIDPQLIQPESPLLAPSLFWARMANVNAYILFPLIALVAAIVLIAFAIKVIQALS